MLQSREALIISLFIVLVEPNIKSIIDHKYIGINFLLYKHASQPVQNVNSPVNPCLGLKHVMK